MIGLADSAVFAVPLALMIACAAVIERHRERRRRAALNRALHELRRPLHFLALVRSASPRMPGRARASAWGQVDAALAALADLDAEVNRRPRQWARRRLRADELVGEAFERWRWPAALLGRELELRWAAGRATVLGDAAALSRALDNLLANSLEHGGARVGLEGIAESGWLRIVVVDDLGSNRGAVASLAGPLTARPSPNGDPRRGHGLVVCARIASAHGGRLALSSERAGTRAALELPLALDSARARTRGEPSRAA